MSTQLGSFFLLMGVALVIVGLRSKRRVQVFERATLGALYLVFGLAEVGHGTKLISATTAVFMIVAAFVFLVLVSPVALRSRKADPEDVAAWAAAKDQMKGQVDRRR
jgi:uncharacterized membrane protein HdeD (DUF308 family)